jgi:hypothetical protein
MYNEGCQSFNIYIQKMLIIQAVMMLSVFLGVLGFSVVQFLFLSSLVFPLRPLRLCGLTLLYSLGELGVLAVSSAFAVHYAA